MSERKRLYDIDLKKEINSSAINKIFGENNGDDGSNNIRSFLRLILTKEELPENLDSLSKQQLSKIVIEHWDYAKALPKIRTLFESSKKYKRYISAEKDYQKRMEEIKIMIPEKLDWAFRPSDFDDVLHQITRRENLTVAEMLNNITNKVAMQMAIKIKTELENDIVEYYVYKNNSSVIPTFGNKKDVDFYIDGKCYDQKVSRGVGKVFVKDYGNRYRDVAKEHPELVMKSLYENQNEDRFHAGRRLQIVRMSDTNDTLNAETTLQNQTFEPINIEFTYNHKNIGKQQYETEAVVIYL